MTDVTRRDEAVELRWGASSHSGRVRAENQDAYVARPPLFMVADGMGGHAAGKEAAALVAGAFDAAIGADWATTEELRTATAAAAAAVRSLAEQTEGWPGSTVTGVAVATHQGQPSWLVFNIGDSRTYLVNDGTLEQVTVDHSRVQELLDHGLADHEARQRASSNVITRAIGGGMRRTPDLDQWLVPIRPGDRILICSDGLTGELSDSLIAATLLATKDPAEAATNLQQAAVAAGGRDNVTVIVVDVDRLRAAPDAADPDALDTLDDSRSDLDRSDGDHTAPDTLAIGVDVGVDIAFDDRRWAG